MYNNVLTLYLILLVLKLLKIFLKYIFN